jgi:hypothetical protein
VEVDDHDRTSSPLRSSHTSYMTTPLSVDVSSQTLNNGDKGQYKVVHRSILLILSYKQLFTLWLNPLKRADLDGFFGLLKYL